MNNFVGRASRLFRLSSIVFCLSSIILLTACSDFITPVKSTPEPTEYSFNYWLLQRVYLYEDELPKLSEDGDSIKQLYNALEDPYTNYFPPAKSNDVRTQLSTSKIIGGDVGMRYYIYGQLEHPIIITRVYPQSPAGRAGVPRYGNIISANKIELTGSNAWATYDSILNYSKKISLLVAYKGDTTQFDLKKDVVYAPTVFIDTLYDDSAKGYPGIVFITIEGFKDTTLDPTGSYGELRRYLESSKEDKRVRVIDLRNNPGGIVRQCSAMADLFVSKGTLYTMHSRSLTADGKSKTSYKKTVAKAGDPGEKGKYIILGNQNSASCSEIFIAAVTELTEIPFIGTRTYGKGVGQTPFDTYAGGIAKITNFEFSSPKGVRYNGVGIYPKYNCENILAESCAAQVAHKLYGVKIPKQENVLAKRVSEVTRNTAIGLEGGAIVWADKDSYLQIFEKSSH